jgi:hypothetical protein
MTICFVTEPRPTVGVGLAACTAPAPEIVTPRRHACSLATYVAWWSTVNELLTFGEVVIVHSTPGKYVAGVEALAGITEKFPATACVVVRLAVAEPGISGVVVIHAPEDPVGSVWVENVPSEPGTTTFVTAAPRAPNANPNC